MTIEINPRHCRRRILLYASTNNNKKKNAMNCKINVPIMYDLKNDGCRQTTTTTTTCIVEICDFRFDTYTILTSRQVGSALRCTIIVFPIS